MPVVGQRADAIRHYIEETGLGLDILADESREVARAYGVWKRRGLDGWNLARPAVFLIERDAHIRYSFVGASQREFPSHEELIAAISGTAC